MRESPGDAPTTVPSPKNMPNGNIAISKAVEIIITYVIVLSMFIFFLFPRKKSMATKQAKGRTKDPATITSVDDWVQAARRTAGQGKSGYTNIIMGPGGELQVMDPGTGVLVKTIPHVYGADLLRCLSSEDTALRASAEEKQSQIRQTIDTNVHSALDEFILAETLLLDTVRKCKGTADPALKRELTIQVGNLSKSLEDAETNLQKARYPHRYLAERQNVPRKTINYPTMDDRGVSITLLKLRTTLTDERVVEIH